jgi:hypothetical protein
LTKLPKSIIKKYGITKKAWRIFKGKRKPSTRPRSGNLSSRKSRGGNMKRKSTRFLGVSLEKDILLPGAYGAIRGKASEFVLPYARMLPGAAQFGNIIDEVGMIAALTLTKKFVRNKLIRDVATNGIRIEAAQIGQAISTNSLGIGGGGMNGQEGLW